MSTSEVDYLMALNESGVVVHDAGSADANNVLEWLDTPRGRIYGKPSWGHELDRFKHEPPESSATVVNVEFEVLTGLSRDIPSLVVYGIRCEPHETKVDTFTITVITSSGEIVGEI